MKLERFIEALERVTATATDGRELEQMRAALIEVRARLERRAEAMRRDSFKRGGRPL
jgi:hypothetical protein